MPTTLRCRYVPPVPGAAPAKFLAVNAGTADEQRFCFYDALEVGRYETGRAETPGHLLIDDPTVSFRHCLIAQTPNGRCTLRDVSRNGPRLDGRRLVPNVEVSVALGQSVEVAPGCSLVLLGDTAPEDTDEEEGGRTMGAAGVTIATVLVGDIRDYTVLVRQAPAIELQRSVARLFERLTEEVTMMSSGGLPKVALRSPPMATPVRVASCSVAATISRAMGTMASPAGKKIYGAGIPPALSRKSVIGMKRNIQLIDGFKKFVLYSSCPG